MEEVKFYDDKNDCAATILKCERGRLLVQGRELSRNVQKDLIVWLLSNDPRNYGPYFPSFVEGLFKWEEGRMTLCKHLICYLEHRSLFDNITVEVNRHVEN